MSNGYLIVNFDKREFIDADLFGDGYFYDGFKVDKHSPLSFGGYMNSTATALALLLQHHWSGDRIGVMSNIGGGVDFSKLPLSENFSIGKPGQTYFYSILTNDKNHFVEAKQISETLMLSNKLIAKKRTLLGYTKLVSSSTCKAENPKLDYNGVIFNHTKQQYIRGAAFGDSNNISQYVTGGQGGVLHALILLLLLSPHTNKKTQGSTTTGFVDSWMGDVIGFLPLEEVSQDAENISDATRNILSAFAPNITYGVENGNMMRSLHITTFLSK